jgi:hypothetical protein
MQQPLYLLRILTRAPVSPGHEASEVLTVVPHGGEPAAVGETIALPKRDLGPDDYRAFVERELLPRLAARREKGEAIGLETGVAGQITLWVERLLPGGIDRVVGSDTTKGTVPAEPDLPTRLRELQKETTWYGHTADRVRASAAGILERFPAARAEVERALDRGRRCREGLERLKRLARMHGPEAEATSRAAAELRREFPEITKSIRKELDFAADVRARAVEARERRTRHEALSTVHPGAPHHRLDRLPAAPSFTLLVDETGSTFESGAPAGREGRLVGVLVPDGVELPPLPPGAHAANASLAAVDARVQAVLDAPVGILGITTAAFDAAPGDLWSVGVAELIHWVARLMPLEGETSLEVKVEARGTLAAGASCEALRAEIVRSLVEADPARYGRLRLHIDPVAKDGHPLLGYADALAFTWGSRSEASRARLRQSGLLGSCLLGGRADELRALREILRRGAEIDGASWETLVSHPDAANDDSLVATQLARLGEASRQQPGLWRRFLEATHLHLDSKALRLGILGREVAWLDSYAPPGTRLAPRLRLAWLVARLEARNHQGETERGPWLEELRNLCDRLFPEDPTLVCQAELDLAVLATNRFDFAGASAALARFRDLPPEVPGLRHWGRVQSSFGQHAAFQGQHGEADGYFARALDAFQRLSDPEVAAGEIAQTGVYRALAALDDPHADPATVRQRVAERVSLSPADIARLAASANSREKYLHHLLVRYLAERGSAEEREAYLGARSAWAADEGHPWPLIEAYRGLLLAEIDRPAALEQLEEARSLAFSAEQGPTVLLIGATIAVAAQGLGAPATVTDEELVDLAVLLPEAAPRIERLRVALRRPRDPLALLREVLPFNFR